MRKQLAAIFVLGALAPAQPAVSVQSGQPSEICAPAPRPTSAIHATRGVVKAIGETMLVVSRPRNYGDIMFTLSSATHRDGKIVVGSTVSVRYREDGKTHVATAIALQKPQS
ncbi:MAG TPA: hypothetical protein VH701_23510 [Vicinamibacterales bacterium]|jgi:hypothetical protein